MKFEIRNYRAVKKANIRAERFTLVGGKGEAGKTSILSAVSNVLTGNCVINGTLKRHQKLLVYNGEQAGYIESTDGSTIAKITYPDPKYTKGGMHPKISPISAGLSSLLDMDKKELSKYIAEITKSEPGEIDLITELKKVGYLGQNETVGTSEEFLGVWESITTNGWDAVCGYEKTEGAKLKGAWEYVAGEKFGTKKAGYYSPDWCLREELLCLDIDEEKKKLLDIKEWLSAAKKTEIVEESEAEKLKELIPMELEVIETKKILDTKKKALIDTMEKASKPIDIIYELTCPKCESRLIGVDGKLVAAGEGWERPKVTKVEKINALKEHLKLVETDCADNKALLSNIEKAKNLKSDQRAVGEKIEAMEVECADLSRKIDSYKKIIEADKIYKKILRKIKLVKILSQEGLRSKLLLGKLMAINSAMEKICTKFDFNVIEIDKNFEIMSKGIPYRSMLLSRSEKYIMDIVIRLVVSMLVRDLYFIIDDFDVMTESQRAKMIQLLKSKPFKRLNFLISYSCDSEDEFSHAFSGINPLVDSIKYWVENGCAERI